jgi:hypothetical protein
MASANETFATLSLKSALNTNLRPIKNDSS